jgi:hypothetical protein
LVHSVVFADYKQLADGLVALKTCCCGLDAQASWLTMASEVAIDDTQRQSAISFHVTRVATLHQATLTALAILPTLVGTSSTITLPDPTIPAPVPVPPADPSGQTAGA